MFTVTNKIRIEYLLRQSVQQPNNIQSTKAHTLLHTNIIKKVII